MMGKRKLIVDVDDVLGEFVISLNDFYNARFGTTFKFEDYTTYYLYEVWQCSSDEAMKILFDFYGDHSFMEIEPTKFSQEVLGILREDNELVAASYRPEEVTNKTRCWIGENFFDMKTFCIGNYGNSHQRRSKLDICRDEGASVIVEDSARNASECVEGGITSILLNKPWNENVSENGFKRVKDWRGALEYLV